MRLSPILLLLVACGTEAPKQASESPIVDDAKARDVVERADDAAAAHAKDTVAMPAPDTLPAPPAPEPARAVRPEEEHCMEYINPTAGGVQMVCYTRPERMTAREEELPGMLGNAWQAARQAAPRSIADDFERGISTEHVHMPDTLDVEVKHYRDCSARQPHTVKQYRVWRTPEGGTGWHAR